MQRLSELVEFVGIPMDSDRVGNPSFRSLSRARRCISTLTDAQRNSLHSIIDALPGLSAITLAAENVGETAGTEPLQVAIRVGANPGAILFTELLIFSDPSEREYMDGSGNLLGKGGVFGNQLGPGSWHLVVRRTGVSNTGYVELESVPFRYQVAAIQRPAPPQQPPVAPTISVVSVGDGSFKVSGKGFLEKKPVFISIGVKNIVANPLVLNDTADAKGEITDFPTGKICTVPGTPLVFAANDGRVVGGHDLFSNSFDISCPA